MDPGSIAIISGAVLGAAGNILGGNQAAKPYRDWETKRHKKDDAEKPKSTGHNT